ncbi:protein NRT1/ PTR FAMILY 4.5-like isoform X2 [Tasmannia lanceolata]|uniref:protein NRT1/ PTR FAMILY 4.5-like isoform X2 n=1 Tax=Tasmannia lanceolata TaxID=3420 RepID=UPI0040631532
MGLERFMDWKGNPINKDRHGGTRAAFFIYFMVGMSSMAFMSNVLDMVTYLHKTMHMGVADSSTTLTNFIGGTCAFALLGGFLSDSYITRFRAILIFGPFEFLGFSLLAIQAHLPSLKPQECNNTLGKLSSCNHVHGYNAAILYIAMYTIALGEGCLRANLASFGGDQFDDDDPIESGMKSSFFNWFTFSISVGSLTGLVLIVWIENNKGWDYGFALSAFVVLLGVIVLGSGFSFYRNQRPRCSPLTRIMQVFVAAFRKRKLVLPENEEDLHKELVKEEMVSEEVLPHTKGFKCLDKASVFHGNTGSRSLCTVTQVEETKVVLRMLPIFICAVFGYMPIPQLLLFTVQQGSTMNIKLGNIHISPATLLVIPMIFQMILLVAYDQLFVPFARRITGFKTGITHLQRIGVGFISTSVATCVAAVIERKRKKIAEEHGLLESGTGVPMSVLWLGVQFLVMGITDVSTFVGLLEFFNSESSRGMKSLGTAIFWCIVGLAALMGSVLVHMVNRATKHGEGGIGWLEGNNLNKNYLDRYYWLLSVLGLVGFLNYLYWARRYVYRQHPQPPSG